jgi:hypothetical protein
MRKIAVLMGVKEGSRGQGPHRRVAAVINLAARHESAGDGLQSGRA